MSRVIYGTNGKFIVNGVEMKMKFKGFLPSPKPSLRKIRREMKIYRAWLKSGKIIGTYNRRIIDWKYRHVLTRPWYNPHYQIDLPF